MIDIHASSVMNLYLQVYMGRGQKSENTGPSHTDASNLLNLMKNCKYFKSHIKELKYINKVCKQVMCVLRLFRASVMLLTKCSLKLKHSVILQI